MLHIVKGNKTCHLLSAFIYRKCFRKYKPFEKCRNVFNCLYKALIHKEFSFMSVVSKRVFTCRILVRTSFTSTRSLLTLPRISERLHEPGELSISSASMKSRLQIRIIKSYNIEIYSFVQNSLWTCAICWKRARIIRSGEGADTILASNLQATYFWHQYKKQSCSAMRLQIKSKMSAENQ